MDGVSFDELVSFMEASGWPGCIGSEKQLILDSGPNFRYYFYAMGVGKPETCPEKAQFLSGLSATWRACEAAPVTWGGCLRRWKSLNCCVPLPSLEES